MAHSTGNKMKTCSSEASQSFAHSPTPPFFHENAAIQNVSTQAIALGFRGCTSWCEELSET